MAKSVLHKTHRSKSTRSTARRATAYGLSNERLSSLLIKNRGRPSRHVGQGRTSATSKVYGMLDSSSYKPRYNPKNTFHFPGQGRSVNMKSGPIARSNQRAGGSKQTKIWVSSPGSARQKQNFRVLQNSQVNLSSRRLGGVSSRQLGAAVLGAAAVVAVGAYAGNKVRKRIIAKKAANRQQLVRAANRGTKSGNHAPAVHGKHRRTFFARNSKGQFS